ncbi:hypothetical protein [Sedimenticola thiotaurini]|uniref:amino acid kinase family protein n=1 Tax=Sedimenticola thiotaurini TaxID=1543721 RepID=UPI0007B0827D|nr:hypothetical protein [Sedimenticola thiotaurini]
MWVVKIGGSLYDTPQLQAWLGTLAGQVDPTIIVPGGGPFADQVREAQQRWRVDDATAHRMALSAMDQYGLLMAGLEPRLLATAGPVKLKQSLTDGRSAVWLPAADDPDVERSWRVTSDSLALWLAHQVGADGVVLIKSAPLTTAREELLDAAFDAYQQQWGVKVRLAHRDGSSDWPALLGK